MNTSRYNSKVMNANYTATFWLFLFLGSGVLNLLLGWFVVTADTAEKTIVTPANYDQVMWVKGNEVSNTYKDEMAKYFADLLLTYHSQNAQAQFEQVLKYVHPAQYNILKAKFLSKADKISRNQLSSVFYRLDSHVMADSVVVTGEELRMVGSQVVGKDPKSYKINLKYENGKIWVEGFFEVAYNKTTDDYFRVNEQGEET